MTETRYDGSRMPGVARSVQILARAGAKRGLTEVSGFARICRLRDRMRRSAERRPRKTAGVTCFPIHGVYAVQNVGWNETDGVRVIAKGPEIFRLP